MVKLHPFMDIRCGVDDGHMTDLLEGVGNPLYSNLLKSLYSNPVK